MANKVHKRLGDGKINTSVEMIEDQEEKLWEQNPMEALRYEIIETRKKLNWMARYVLSMIIVLTFLFLIWLLFYGELPQASRDLVNIMGAMSGLPQGPYTVKNLNIVTGTFHRLEYE